VPEGTATDVSDHDVAGSGSAHGPVQGQVVTACSLDGKGRAGHRRTHPSRPDRRAHGNVRLGKVSPGGSGLRSMAALGLGCLVSALTPTLPVPAA
jgi:hypothetical protein